MPAASWKGIQLNSGTGPKTSTSEGELGIGETIEIVVPRTVALSRYKIIL